MHNITVVVLPPNCTSRLQPMVADITMSEVGLQKVACTASAGGNGALREGKEDFRARRYVNDHQFVERSVTKHNC